MKTTLLAAASAVVLSAGIASAAPAITKSAVTLRAGPGPQYQVVGRLPARAAVDVEGCSMGWCAVSWRGAGGYVNAGLLQIAGGPGPVVSGSDYYYDEPPDYLYATPGFYGPAFRHHRHRSGGWQHGGPPVTAQPGRPQPGFAGPPVISRGNPGIGQVRGAPQVSAPVGLRTGGPAISAPAAPSISAPAAAPAAPAAAAPAAPSHGGRGQ
jgi:uncharacterized protein YraI